MTGRLEGSGLFIATSSECGGGGGGKKDSSITESSVDHSKGCSKGYIARRSSREMWHLQRYLDYGDLDARDEGATKALHGA